MFARSRPTRPNSRAAASSSFARVASLVSAVIRTIYMGDQSPTILHVAMLAASCALLGLKVPEPNPLFLAALSPHVVAAILCVVAGATAALSAKGSVRHIRSGRIYYWSLAVVFVTATTMAAMRWAEDYYLFIIGSIAITRGSVGHLHPR